MKIGAHGIERKLNLGEVLDSIIQAWFDMDKCLFEWAWIATGMISAAEMQEVNKHSEEVMKNRCSKAELMIRNPLAMSWIISCQVRHD